MNGESSLAHIAILVRDLDTAESFYQAVFGMRTVWKKGGEKAYLTTGNNDILGLLVDDQVHLRHFDLHAMDVSQPNTPNFFHFGTVTTSDEEFESILDRARKLNIDVVGPKTSRDETRSFYFKDPEGYCLQVVKVPASYFSSDAR